MEDGQVSNKEDGTGGGGNRPRTIHPSANSVWRPAGSTCLGPDGRETRIREPSKLLLTCKGDKLENKPRKGKNSRKPKGNVSRAVGHPQPVLHDSRVVGFGCADLRVEVIPCWLARVIITAKHYSRRVVNNSYFHVGCFAGRELVGVLQWGYALNPASGKRVVFGTGNREYMELNRMWVHDCMPRNTESRVVSYSIKLIKILHPQIQWVQSFADERCGKAGVVYQACSFDYVGSHLSTFYELNGEWYHSLARSRAGGVRGTMLRQNLHLAKAHRFRQYRYIRFLNKGARRRLNTKLFKVQPYPKPMSPGDTME